MHSSAAHAILRTFKISHSLVPINHQMCCVVLIPMICYNSIIDDNESNMEGNLRIKPNVKQRKMSAVLDHCNVGND